MYWYFSIAVISYFHRDIPYEGRCPTNKDIKPSEYTTNIPTISDIAYVDSG